MQFFDLLEVLSHICLQFGRRVIIERLLKYKLFSLVGLIVL